MQLLLFFCLTSLIGSVHGGVLPHFFSSRNAQKSRTASNSTGYTRMECGLQPSYESFLETGKKRTAGRYAKAGEFPWHVSIQSHGRHICGGAIISALWILTAAHCVAEEVPPDLTVVVGGTDLSHPLEEHKPENLIIHKNFDRMSMENDIALILLGSPIEFSSEKVPVCLPFIHDIDTWQQCWVAGWGSASGGSHVLQKVRMKLISREQCLEQIPELAENALCAKLEKGEREACEVDSGGPLVCSYWKTMKWFQVAIVSWGEDCAEEPNHEILVSVYNYRDWIETETAKRGKPFFTEGIDISAHARMAPSRVVPSRMAPSRVVPSRAETQLVFLEYPLLLFISLIAFRVL